MEKLDIVYFVKPDQVNSELVYSLRSVDRNFPCRNVWFYGGQPIDLIPDFREPIVQKGENRYEKVRNMLRRACKNPDLTEDFWLFNDDFFILKPMDEVPAWYQGTLPQRIREIETRRAGKQSGYTRQLRRTTAMLQANGLGILNYAVHVPMKINRKKMLETLNRFPDCPMFRALYGNHHCIGGIDRPDVKIFTPEIGIAPDADLVSTSDSSFLNGLVGKQIRECFPDKSRWEV